MTDPAQTADDAVSWWELHRGPIKGAFFLGFVSALFLVWMAK